MADAAREAIMPHSHWWLNRIHEAVHAHLMTKTSEPALLLRFKCQRESSMKEEQETLHARPELVASLYLSLLQRMEQVIA